MEPCHRHGQDCSLARCVGLFLLILVKRRPSAPTPRVLSGTVAAQLEATCPRLSRSSLWPRDQILANRTGPTYKAVACFPLFFSPSLRLELGCDIDEPVSVMWHHPKKV